MNREIKFRAKRKDNGEWVYSHGIYKNKWGNVFMLYERLTLPYSPKMDGYGWVEVIPETVGQYTGLKDKNGKEIYEGDIVQIKQYRRTNYIIKWDEEGCGFIMKKVGRNFLTDVPYPNKYGIIEEFEVIGNIYENPELMKEVDE